VDIASHCFSPNDRKLQVYRMMYLRISKKLWISIYYYVWFLLFNRLAHFIHMMLIKMRT
jgi:hypothetical protein